MAASSHTAPPLLTLVRHGRTAHNAAGRFQGWADIPLDDTGHKQARLLAEHLTEHPVTPTRLYASDLSRAAQTAAPLAINLGLQAVSTPALREIHIGRWEGLTFTEIESLDAGALQAWPLKGAPGGESIHEVAVRLRSWLDALDLTRDEHVIVVTHGAAITALLCNLLDWDYAEAWAEHRGAHENTAFSTLTLDLPITCHPLACAAHLHVRPLR
ncbi:histidine phosphatase family protein [Deinococcus altitudinis]|uniref:histidine phosphatase family protein n=1 Tax=Deinococcus altitudinis TaxID=468914 RepID=UPI003891AF71